MKQNYFLFLFLISNLGFSQLPNDQCSNAISIPINGFITGTTVGANSSLESLCTNFGGPGIWYKLTDNSGTGLAVELNTCSGTNYDSWIDVYSGSCGALNCLTSNDDNCGLSSSVTFNTDGSSTYYVLIHGYRGAQGDFDLSVSSTTLTNEAPNAVCKDFTAQLGSDGTVTINPANVDGGSTDDKPGFTLSIDKESFDCSNIGAPVEVTLTVIDSDGVTDSCKATVTVEDNIAPIVTAQDVTVYLDEDGRASLRDDFSVGTVAGELEPQNSSSTDTPVDCNCPEGYVAVGYEGATGWILDDFRLVCKEVLPDGSLGTETVETCFSGSRTLVNRTNILSGSDVLVGFEVQDGDYSSQQSSRTHVSIKGIGKSLHQIANGELNTNENTMLPALSGSGTATTNFNTTTRFAPAGHAIVGMSVNQSTGYSSTVSFKYAPLSGFLSMNNGSADNCGIASISVDKSNFSCEDVGENTVTLAVVDNNGNEASATATVTVVDNIAPVVATKNITVQLDASGEASLSATDVNNGSIDNCSIPSLEINDNLFTCENIENPTNYSLSFAATNGYTITEDASRDISGANGITLEGWIYPTNSGFYQFLMGFRNDVDADFYLLQMPNNSIEARFRNSTGTVFNMTVGSLLLNEWQHLALSFDGADLHLYVNGEIVSSIPATGSFKDSELENFYMGASDRGGDNFYFSGNLEDVRLWNRTRTQTEIKAAMNMSIPRTEENLVINYGFADGAGSIVTDQSGNSLNANFFNLDETTTWVEDSPTESENLVVLSVTDVNGNVGSAVAVVTVEDVTDPELTAEANQDVNLDADCSITVPNLVDGSTATDNCTVTITQSPEAGTVVSSEHNGTVDVKVTATDAAGNTAETTVVLTAKDVTNPELTAEANQDVNLDADCSITVPNLVDGSTATDNCTVTITQSPEAGTVVSSEHNGTVDVKVTATDAAGNTAEATVVLTAKDVTNPILTAEADQEVNLDADCSISVPNLVDGSTAADNCTVTITQSPEAGTVVSSEHNGTVDVKVTATDAAGNTAETTVLLTAKDVTDPELTAEADQDVDLDTNCSITVPNLVDGSTATDNCTVTITQSPEAGTVVSSEHNGTVDVKVTATDAAGNTAETTVVLTAKDVTNPELTAEANQDVNLDADCSITVPNLVDGSTATDNCTVTITQSPEAGTVVSSEHNGTVDVKVTATDAAGNTAETTVVLTAKDETNPILTAEANQDVNLDADCSVTVPNLVDGSTAIDNCTVTITQSPEAGTVVSSEHNGTVDVKVTATDAAGNTAETTVLLTAKDVTNPVLTAEANQDVNLDADCSVTVPNLVDGSTATDNCTVTLTQSPEAGTVVSSEHNGTVDVKVTATDAAGNTAEATVVLTAKDVTNPILTAEANQDVNLDADCSITVPNLVDGSTAIDNCTVTITQSPEAGTVVSSEHDGTVDVKVTATDAAGNTAEATVVLTAKDVTKPILTAEADQEVNLDADCSITVPNLVDGSTATDNCTVTITQSPEAGTTVSSEHNEIVDVVVTATDAAGNFVKATVKLTAKDKIAPVPVMEALDLITSDCEVLEEDVLVPVALDNCEGEVKVTHNVAFPINAQGSTVITWTYTDEAGNTSTQTQEVFIEDKTAPVVFAKDIVVSLDVEGKASISPEDVLDSVLDNCGIASMSLDISSFGCDETGVNFVLLSVTDVNGNTGTAEAIVEVVNSFGDNDSDGLPNNCDDDDDNDGVPDEEDNAPFIPNPDQTDTDGDGEGDVLDTDDDNDGVLDVNDNCPLAYNPGQGDIDRDGKGDVCDTEEILVSEAMTPNGDGVNDTWRIVNIENYPNAMVVVYNIWGNEVFRSRAYRNDWNGERNGDLLPEGSYYYQIYLTSSSKMDKDGWLYLTK
ncbi:T9SS type B sorting domain-containing protein [Salinimicrobium sp. CAU 1759]